MNVQNFMHVNYANTQPKQVKQSVSFQATLPEMKDALIKDAKRAEQGKKPLLCTGKQAMMMAVLNCFKELEDKMAAKGVKSFDFKLGENNDVPDELKDIKLSGKAFEKLSFIKKENTTSIEGLDKEFNGEKDKYSCGDDSHCSCGSGQTLGEFLSQVVLGKLLKVSNPDKIELGK